MNESFVVIGAIVGAGGATWLPVADVPGVDGEVGTPVDPSAPGPGEVVPDLALGATVAPDEVAPDDAR